jgi:hypothetical protein
VASGARATGSSIAGAAISRIIDDVTWSVDCAMRNAASRRADAFAIGAPGALGRPA